MGKGDLGLQKLNEMRERLDAIQVAGQQFSRRPRVYFEEWDEPKISAIRWVSELIQIAGGDNCFEAESRESGAMNRVVTDEAVIARDPEIVVGAKVNLLETVRTFNLRRAVLKPCGFKAAN